MSFFADLIKCSLWLTFTKFEVKCKLWLIIGVCVKLDLKKLDSKANVQVEKSKKTHAPQGDEELRELLKKIRKKKSVTQEQIATFSNLSRFAVNEFETGKTDVKLSTFFKLLKAYGVSLEIQE